MANFPHFNQGLVLATPASLRRTWYVTSCTWQAKIFYFILFYFALHDVIVRMRCNIQFSALSKRVTFLAALWTIWKERNARCFEGKESSVEELVKKLKQAVASWMLILPHFKGIPLETIVRNWREVVCLPQWDWVLGCCEGFTLVIFCFLLAVLWCLLSWLGFQYSLLYC